MLNSLLDVFGSPAVTLAYYLFTFFAIEAALVIAWGQWQRSDSFRARRLTVVFGSLTVLRVMLFMLALIGRNSAEIANFWLPPFERALGVASLGFLVWGFTPFMREKGFAGTVLLAINTTFAFIFFFLAASFWGGSDFNRTGWELFFVAWQLLLALFGAINCASKLDDERAYALSSFGALGVGYVLHFFFLSRYPAPHDPVWVRLVEMFAYPVFAVAVYQGAIQSLRARTEEFQNLSQISLDQIKGLISLFEATREITSSLDLSHLLDGATRSVADAIGADQCAIALPEDNSDDLSQLRLVSIYNPSRKGRGESVSFPLNDQQAIKHALKRKYQVQIDEYQDNNQIRLLFTLMGAHDVGPLIIQPLLQRSDEPLGVLILGNANSKRVFTSTEAQLCKTLADQISVSIGHAKEYAAVSAKAQQLSWTLRNQELESGKRRAAMETELKKSREEVALFAQRLYEYEKAEKVNEEALRQARERANKLEKAIDRAKVEVEKATQKDKQLATLSSETEAQKKRLADLEAERQASQEKIEQLEQETVEAAHLKETLATANERARKLARALKHARAVSQQAAPVPAALSSAEVSAELEDLSCGVIIGDANYKINRVNAVASQWLVRPNNNLIGSELTTIIEDERWQKALEKIKSKNEPMVSTTLKVGDNVLRATISPMASSDGNGREGTVTILYDITAEAESQQARDEFVASLSQELRTPMTSITGYTDLLLGESVGMIGEMQRKFLQRIKANIERMGSMLSDLIGVTAIDAGQLEIRPGVVDMAEVIEDTIIGARAQLEENEITLTMSLLDDMPPVAADPDSVRQIMSNLLSNAIKSTPVGGVIEISTSLENSPTSPQEDAPSFLKISIRDSGGGIADKDLNRVFERFYRAERPLIEGLGETGVGLAIVKSLIEAHGGRVWVESEIGEGSTFHFILPISDQFNDPWLEVDIPPLDLSSDQSDSF
ncbi:MAG: GAF domain-containing protein [Chloroflexi bacterium]|nr:GAF domain-containing protein [Chloroflexota bacterium]